MLTSLPVELIFKIFSVLDWRTLLVCREICRLFRSIAEGDRAQYDIELAVSGMMDGPPSPLTTSDRLALLKGRNAAWESLKWVESKDIPMMQGHIWELYGDVFAQSSTPDVLHFRQLPSTYRKIEEKSWNMALDIHVRDFTMDPAQDLLVLIEQPPTVLLNPSATTRSIRIHLRSLTTGDSHRLAPRPAILVHDLDVRNARATYTLQVCGNLLGVLFMSPEDADPELTIWNWTTGKVILTRSSSEIATFAFLSSRFLLVGSIFDPEALNIQARLYVFDLTQPSNETSGLAADCFCAFMWPEFNFWTSPVTFSIRSDPSPVWQPNPEARLPFSTAPGDRLIIVTACLVYNGHVAYYDMFVSAGTLLSHIAALPTEVSSHEIDWDEWGPTGTRLMRSLSHSSPWVCYVFGTKFVSLVATQTSPQTLEIRDFNQLALKRDAKVQDGIIDHVRDTTVIRRVFANEVHTSLPYRVIQRTLPPRSSTEPFFAAVMCSEDNLILVDSSQRHLRILTF
ncbi:hypothetical protein DEU56DRAFT_769753 [Suillus clintonianus]|uniref:uncharacterized protein n=1 Tax=Suillus clintonianus TaxID=1904413 RepID=UPI001B88024F|nr:uncharacterized protein DEU56DRAFT_769753 [Suillus clintonianus]KAG2154684.1 hypothetical protein DEU56DRAFT_769753 [Suillus clintonianus]